MTITSIILKGKPEDAILGFQGEYRWLSNFWTATITLDEFSYKTPEHAYQAAKTLDRYWRRRIREARSPSEAKRLGRLMPVREDWIQIRLSTMLDLQRQKYKHEVLRDKLIETGDRYIEETNDWGDTFWGVDTKKGGLNHLGEQIMLVRKEITSA